MTSFLPRRADVVRIAAVQHPLRRRLWELLSTSGPATASQLAERTGQLVGNISHHLKMLSVAGLIEEAAELARDRRERWWRAVPFPAAHALPGQTAGSTMGASGRAAADDMLARVQAVARRWIEQRHAYEPEWRQAAYASDFWLTLTPEELVELGERISDLVAQFERTVDTDDGQEREDVLCFAYAVPAQR